MNLSRKDICVVAAFLIFLFTLSTGTPASAQDSAPSVETVGLVNPPSDGVHIFGDTVEVEVWFDHGGFPVVNGSPRFALTIGADTRYAEHWSTGSSGSKGSLGFRYVVQSSDRDDDGIGIPANALSLNGGAIKDSAGNDHDLSHDPVPDDPAVIGSGPTIPDPTTFAEALAICRAASGAGELPRAALETLERGARGEIEESPKPDDARLAGAAFHLIGSRRDAVEGAVRKARELGCSTAIIDEPVTGEARKAGEDHVRTIARLAYERPRPLCIVSAGETTVRVTGKGRGGRNQEFALAAAFHLARRFPEAVIASVGSDGIDGPTDAAGALVDTTTPARATERGLQRPEHYLAANDSHAFFEALGDLIRTGPTGTNVGDLQVALIG